MKKLLAFWLLLSSHLATAQTPPVYKLPPIRIQGYNAVTGAINYTIVTATSTSLGSVKLMPPTLFQDGQTPRLTDYPAPGVASAGRAATWSNLYELAQISQRSVDQANAKIGDLTNTSYDVLDNFNDNVHQATNLLEVVDFVYGRCDQTMFRIDALDSNGNGAVDNAETLNGHPDTYFATASQVNSVSAQIGTYLRSLDGYAPGRVLVATSTLPGFAWTTMASSGTTTGSNSGTTSGGGSTTTSSGTGTTGLASITFTQADSTANRVDLTAMTVVNVADATTLRGYLTSSQANKQFVLADGDYTGYFEQNANWSNCEIYSPTGNARLINSGASTVFLFQNTHTVNRVRLRNLKFESTYTASGNPILWWNELPSITGLEVANCSFTGPGGSFNAMGAVCASTASQAGNITRDVYIHNNRLEHIGRCGIEFLSQVYDGVVRLQNLTVANNYFADLGKQDQYGMAFSGSGLFRQVLLCNNVASESRRIAYEFVNQQDVVARNNKATNLVNDGVFYGISDDNHHTTRNIYVFGGTCNMLNRAFYAYDTEDVHIDGQNQLWKSHQGNDINVSNSSFTNLNLLIHSTSVESGWQVGGGTNHVTVTNSTVSSAGAAAAGYHGSYESIVLRPGSHDNTLQNVTTVLGTESNGQPAAAGGGASAGADGRIVDQGTNNTLTNNTKSVVP